jgi:hypothetical protein
MGRDEELINLKWTGGMGWKEGRSSVGQLGEARSNGQLKAYRAINLEGQANRVHLMHWKKSVPSTCNRHL